MATQWLTGWWNHGSPTENQRAWQHQRQRIERYFDCYWVSVWGDQKARVSSISPTGCYIDSRSIVPAEGTHLPEISVALPGGELTLEGTVIGATPGAGFAVRFTGVNREARTRLCRLVGLAA